MKILNSFLWELMEGLDNYEQLVCAKSWFVDKSEVDPTRPMNMKISGSWSPGCIVIFEFSHRQLNTGYQSNPIETFWFPLLSFCGFNIFYTITTPLLTGCTVLHKKPIRFNNRNGRTITPLENTQEFKSNIELNKEFDVNIWCRTTKLFHYELYQ